MDTATPSVTVALHDGTRVAAQATTLGTHRHAELLAPAISQVLADAGAARSDLTAIAVGVGPGPFTGLRVGIVTARVTGAALHIPVYGVCSLDVIAAEVSAAGDTAAGQRGTGFLVATDARRREVYWARYERGSRVAGPHVGPAAEVELRGELPAYGDGSWLFPDLMQATEGPRYPCAAVLAQLAAAQLAAPPGGGQPGLLLPPDPLYLRRPDAREPGAPKRVTAPGAATPPAPGQPR